MVKNLFASARDAGDMGSVPGSGRPLGWEMATPSCIFALEIPQTQESGGYCPGGLKELDLTEHTHTYKQVT